MVRAMGKQFWLMKSEPDQFGIADLARVEREPWTGVRSYFARAHMRAMSAGDAVLFHHSNATPPGVAGLASVSRTGVVDQTQFDPDSKYYDAKATRDKPIWDCVEVDYVATLPHFVSMDRMRAEPALSDMMLLQGRGMRLSVQPVTEAEYEAVVRLGHTAPPPPLPKLARAGKPKAAGPKKPLKASQAAAAARGGKSGKAARHAKRPTGATAASAAKPAARRTVARSPSATAARQATSPAGKVPSIRRWRSSR
jgi:predicted RNA-binding protein with PUA-like domain